MAAGTQLPPALVRYWTAGEGGAKIDWGHGGDFARCEKLVQEAITKDGKAPLAPNVIAGLCATLHRLATGATPGHAVGERMGKH